nr:PREDICTED: uncharacterized protein LOC105675285 [Linepithema humile]
MLHHFVKAFGTLNWSWFKWDQQLQKIWNLSVLQSNELDVNNVNWLKIPLSWIVGARFVIGRVSLLAYGANIYTIISRRRQNLLVFWMVLSVFKDIILEVIVIVITFLLWYKGNVPTSHFVGFILEKTAWLFFLTYKWCTTLKWHTQLRKVEKIRRFTLIARRSIANIVHAPGKVRISLQDEYLSPAIARRNKYASLLNLDMFSDESFNRVNFDLRASKSLTTLATNDSDDSNDTNNHDPIANDLSVAEKSMKMLNVTAEDVMDARARIQERSYWNEQNVPSDAMEELVTQFTLEKVEDKKDNVDHTLKEEDTVRDHPTEKERKKDDSKNSLTDSKDEILSRKQEENILLVKNVTPEKTKKEVKRAVKIVQCPSNKENMEAKPCASFVRKLEAKLCSISANQKEKKVDQKMHPCQVKTKSTSASTSLNKEEFDKNSETLCACRRVSRNIYTSKNGKYAQSININDKSVKHDVDKKEFKRFVSTGITQKGKVNEYNSTSKYSEIYRLKKQIKKSEDSFRKQSATWESMSLARTAHVSGYAKNVVATDKISISPTETFNESNDSLNARRRLKYIEQMRSGPSVDVRSIFKIASLRRKNYAEFEAYNLTLLEDKKGAKMRKSSNRKLSIEKREAIERSALRICNESTLLENKKELEAEKKHNLSSNHKQPIKMSKMKVLGADDLTLRNKKNVETTRRLNLSPSYKQSIEESNTSKTRNKLAEDTRELQARKIHNPMKYETSKYEDVETSSVSNFSEANYENTTISLSETHRNANARTLLNLREITRNIEWTIHPRGITLINKNLYSQFLENGRFHESRQRDIVDDNIANALHGALFFKPEITTGIFRRASTRIGESFPNIPTFLRQDFNTEFTCRVNNEMIVRDHFSFFDLDFERMMGDQNLESSHDSENHVVEEEENHDLCPIFVDPVPDQQIFTVPDQQIFTEPETGIENSTEIIRPQEDARSSTGNVQAINILTFDENHKQVDNGTSDNLPVQSVIEGSKSFYIEVPEESLYNATLPVEQLEEQGNMSHAIGDNGFQAQKLNKNVEILKSKAMQNSARNEDEDREMIYEKANEFSTGRFFRMSSVEKLQQDDSYYSTYERNDNRSNTPVSLENGSLMEEFSNDIPPEQSSDSSANNSRHSQ